jgi:hypothetical protein
MVAGSNVCALKGAVGPMARYIDEREISGAIDFDGARRCDLRAVADRLNIEIETYGEAAHAIRRWFATMAEPGARY